MCGFAKSIYPKVCKGCKTADIAQCLVIYVGTNKQTSTFDSYINSSELTVTGRHVCENVNSV